MLNEARIIRDEESGELVVEKPRPDSQIVFVTIKGKFFSREDDYPYPKVGDIIQFDTYELAYDPSEELRRLARDYIKRYETPLYARNVVLILGTNRPARRP